MITVQGKEFPFSSLNANDADRVDAARKAFKAQWNTACQKAVHMPTGDGLRTLCRVVLEFIDQVLGEGAAALLGLDENTCDKALLCMNEMIEAVETEQKSFKEMFQPSVPAPIPQNRAQRRQQKKHKPRSRSEGFAPALQMVERVDDKAARRAELLRELNALEHE